jgi:hypothetical protein
MVSVIFTIGMWIFTEWASGFATNVMWIYRMGHMVFELWLGQANPRRPVHCAGNKAKKSQKRPHENHYIVGVTPKEWAFSKKSAPKQNQGTLIAGTPYSEAVTQSKVPCRTPKKKIIFPTIP